MTVDSELLDRFWRHLRDQLTEAGVDLPAVPVGLTDQVRSAWRFDMAAVGLDSTSAEQVAGTLGGLAIAVKQMMLMMGGLPPTFWATWLRLYESVSSLMSDPTPWVSPTGDVRPVSLTDPQSVIRMAEWASNAPGPRLTLGGPGFHRGADPSEASPAEPQTPTRKRWWCPWRR